MAGNIMNTKVFRSIMSRRLTGDRLTWDGQDIHCEQGLEALLPDRLGGGTWRTVSFEYNSSGWYMPGYPGISPVGLWARESKG